MRSMQGSLHRLQQNVNTLFHFSSGSFQRTLPVRLDRRPPLTVMPSQAMAAHRLLDRDRGWERNDDAATARATAHREVAGLYHGLAS